MDRPTRNLILWARDRLTLIEIVLNSIESEGVKEIGLRDLNEARAMLTMALDPTDTPKEWIGAQKS